MIRRRLVELVAHDLLFWTRARRATVLLPRLHRGLALFGRFAQLVGGLRSLGSLGNFSMLPSVADEPVPKVGLSRAVVQRMQRRRRWAHEVNQIVGALNWLAEDHHAQSDETITASQKEVWSEVAGGHELYAVAPVLAPREGASALLKGRSSYELDESTLRSFNRTAAEAPFARDVLPGPERALRTTCGSLAAE